VVLLLFIHQLFLVVPIPSA